MRPPKVHLLLLISFTIASFSATWNPNKRPWRKWKHGLMEWKRRYQVTHFIQFNLAFVHKVGSRSFNFDPFSLFSSFNCKWYLKIGNDGSLTADVWYRKQSLWQLSHNNYPCLGNMDYVKMPYLFLYTKIIKLRSKAFLMYQWACTWIPFNSIFQTRINSFLNG